MYLLTDVCYCAYQRACIVCNNEPTIFVFDNEEKIHFTFKSQEIRQKLTDDLPSAIISTPPNLDSSTTGNTVINANLRGDPNSDGLLSFTRVSDGTLLL